ncbi:S8 family serine peptidase [Rurimicrobium arvi]|uniref:Peptidase S8/S53 domain-containing protein n=1 Tax=Rurimicrobium arvi TaxID=2049916 RepID=A0ABP8N339_9BACT
MKKNRHVLLLNPKSDKPKFNRQRNVSGKKPDVVSVDDDEQTVLQSKVIKETRKDRLRLNNAELYRNRKIRNENRTIKLPQNIDLIKIHFFCNFNSDLKKKFFGLYGLSPVEYSDFNKTVLFEVSDQNLFKRYVEHVQAVVESEEGTTYEGKPYNLIALVLKFKFVGARRRMFPTEEEGILLTLISSANVAYKSQKESLFAFLEQSETKVFYNDEYPDLIEVDKLSSNQKKTIAENFDIVRAITSARTIKIRPGTYGTVRREYGFNVVIPDGLTTVGVIDTGLTIIDPLKDLVEKFSYDHTSTAPFWDEEGHGTAIAGLIVFGDDFHKEVKASYVAKARIAVIKAIHNSTDPINIPNLLSDIRDARNKYGIKLFNMSLNIPGAKNYNANFSQFAYELDKLSYEEDVLIFLSVGNVQEDYLSDMILVDRHPDHEYPIFFYKPEKESPYHDCRNTNISEPSESLNNVSIGALAGNLEDGDNTDITPNDLSPAYYSRKFHLDFSRSVNSTLLKKNNKNKFINKPDMVFEGGDLFDEQAGMEILKSPLADGKKYYGRTCGTSLATPLVTSYAAEILHSYPSLRTQTVKAILINSSKALRRADLPEFKTSNDALLKSLSGFGRPQKDDLLATDNNCITFVIEQEIKNGQIIGIPIHLPEYLQTGDNKLRFDITLCYSFMPVKDNHLNYLPIHISVNILKNVDMETISEKTQKDYGIKPSFTWSEDHFGLENCLFSNAQSISRNLQAADIVNENGSVILGVRCLVKKEIPDLDAYTQEASHPFSVVIKITELPESKANNKLYDEMIACNEIEVIGEGDAEGMGVIIIEG